MNALFIDQGLIVALKFFTTVFTDYPQVGLFTNDHDPVADDTNADYDECVLNGYVRLNLASVGWAYSNPVTGKGLAQSTTFSWVFDPYMGSTTIFGWCLFGGTADEIICAAKLDTPYEVPAPGGFLAFGLKIGDLPTLLWPT